MTEIPGWWAEGVEVRYFAGGPPGVIRRTAGGWVVQTGDETRYIKPDDCRGWGPVVRQNITQGQLVRIAHDAERAVLRTFGCHYVPEFEALPESVRATAPRPRAVNRPELDGLLALVRGAVLDALGPYATEP